MDIKDSVTVLKGVGPKKAELLGKFNIKSVEDMLFFFPRDYEDRRNVMHICDLKNGQPALVKAKVAAVIKDGYRRGKKQLLRLSVSDGTGSLEVVFFNARYLQNSFHKGDEYVFCGKPQNNFGKLQLVHPEFNRSEDAESGILPVYPLKKGISQKDMREWQRSIHHLICREKEFLSEDILRENRLCSIEYALENIHFPKEKQKLLEAKYRLIFDELLVLQTGMFAVRQNIKEGKNGIGFSKAVDVAPYINRMPYSLTSAQKRCVEDILRDLESTKMMNRLIQGDVGSGKTSVAEIAMYKTVKSGYQAVLMAPTEVLARQHYDGFCRNFESHGIKVGFLSGSMKAAEKRDVIDMLKTGDINILVGTHAIIRPEVEFKNLGLVITDEQHRFGVNQRIKLKEKGKHPNVLVMTATPIPRTLAVILYGDLDVSVIDELPPGRREIKTKSLSAADRNKAYDFMEKQLSEGRQAYVVAPLIEESEVLDVKSAEEIAAELKKRFDSFNVALLHGAMKQNEKDSIMESFYRGSIDVLVATVVIEVGINVPNASVILIENAERFGLAQLHQLRGRVGRGKYQSYCILISDLESEIAKKRAEIMERSSDGFYIAEEDMKIRGPGEIFGTRQHGLPDLNISDLAKHLKILNHAKETAKKILRNDPLLEKQGNAALRERVIKLFGNDFQLNL